MCECVGFDPKNVSHSVLWSGISPDSIVSNVIFNCDGRHLVNCQRKTLCQTRRTGPCPVAYQTSTRIPMNNKKCLIYESPSIASR